MPIERRTSESWFASLGPRSTFSAVRHPTGTKQNRVVAARPHMYGLTNSSWEVLTCVIESTCIDITSQWTARVPIGSWKNSINWDFSSMTHLRMSNMDINAVTGWHISSSRIRVLLRHS